MAEDSFPQVESRIFRETHLQGLQLMIKVILGGKINKKSPQGKVKTL